MKHCLISYCTNYNQLNLILLTQNNLQYSSSYPQYQNILSESSVFEKSF
jgi:hypothetical protein